MTQQPQRLYKLEESSRWQRVALDAMDVLFHRTSGQTHILIEPAPQILDCLADGPITAWDVIDKLTRLYALEHEDRESIQVSDLITGRLEEMVALGFVRYGESSRVGD